MSIELDHLILNVNDAAASIAFFVDVFGFAHEGKDGPFDVIRVSAAFTLLLAPWGTKGGEHLAFAMTPDEFDVVFKRLRDKGIAYGDSFHNVGNNLGPGDELGAKGMGKSLYFFDPNKHLIEIRHYS